MDNQRYYISGVGQRLGWLLLLSTSMALGPVHILLGPAIPGLGEDGGRVGDLLAAALFATAAFASAGRPARHATIALGLVWMAIAGINLRGAITDPLPLSNWVAFAESALFAVATGAGFDWRAKRIFKVVLVPATATVLALFGFVHLTEHQALATLVPEWVPNRTKMPFVTGTLQLVIAAALFVARTRRIGAITAAAMFASWLPLVHADRLATDPLSGFEWGFALTALGLIGVTLRLAGATVQAVGIPAPSLRPSKPTGAPGSESKAGELVSRS